MNDTDAPAEASAPPAEDTPADFWNPGPVATAIAGALGAVGMGADWEEGGIAYVDSSHPEGPAIVFVDANMDAWLLTLETYALRRLAGGDLGDEFQRLAHENLYMREAVSYGTENRKSGNIPRTVPTRGRRRPPYP